VKFLLEDNFKLQLSRLFYFQTETNDTMFEQFMARTYVPLILLHDINNKIKESLKIR
jgi:hypothetical protein